ncbi:MAG: patatin-like phospholipase family protein [Candidatus Woesearchaeota archaeon]
MPKKQRRKAKKQESRPKVGIALSGGTVRGLSHIGVLRVLERENIPIDFIAGTSIGALIGALYASGIKIDDIEQIVKTTKLRKLIDFTVPKTGFIAGKRIENYIGTIIKNKNFEDLHTKLSIIATELNRGEKFVFTEGNLTKAIRASISMPGVFEPVIDNNFIFVDGGLADPIPVDVVKKMGADIVIAIDLTLNLKQMSMSQIQKEESDFTEFIEKKFVLTELKYLKKFLKKKKIRLPLLIKTLLSPKKILKLAFGMETPDIVKYQIRSHDILSTQLSREKLKYPYVDIIIRPEFENIVRTQFDKIDEIIRAGEIAAEEVIPKIKKLINRNT